MLEGRPVLARGLGSHRSSAGPWQRPAGGGGGGGASPLEVPGNENFRSLCKRKNTRNERVVSSVYFHRIVSPKEWGGGAFSSSKSL